MYVDCTVVSSCEDKHVACGDALGGRMVNVVLPASMRQEALSVEADAGASVTVFGRGVEVVSFFPLPPCNVLVVGF